MTTYEASLDLRAARDRYFLDNAFGEDGGYSAKWVDFMLGSIPVPFPNTAGRVRAVRFHDLHHVLTGYATDALGEFEISAWEIGAGCKDYLAAWQINLGGLAAGVVTIPRRTFAAFARGRRATSLYGRDYDALLERTVGEMQAECGLADGAPAPRAADYLLFAAATVAGVVVNAPFIAVLPAAVAYGLLVSTLRVRAAREEAAPIEEPSRA